MSKAKWPLDILDQICRRDDREIRPFREMFDAYANILKKNRIAEAKPAESQRAPSSVADTSKSMGVVGMIFGTNSRESQLEAKVTKLQDDLSASYRIQAENYQSFIRVKNHAERDQAALLKKEEECAALRMERDSALEAAKDTDEKFRERSRVAESTSNELSRCLSSLEEMETKMRELSEENEQLIAQLLGIKQGHAAEFNRMNEKHQPSSEKRGFSSAEEIDSSSIFDAIAWKSNFVGVSIPKEAKEHFQGHIGVATCVRHNSDGTMLVSGGLDSLVRVWDSGSGKSLGEVRGGVEFLMNVCFSHDGSFILGAGNNGVATLWRTKNSRVAHNLTGHKDKVYGACFSVDSRSAITGSHDSTLRVWDVGNGRNSHTINAVSGINHVAISPNGDSIASGHVDSSIRIWSLRTREAICELGDLHSQQVTSVDFTSDGMQFLTNSRDGRPSLVDIRTYKTVMKFQTRMPSVDAFRTGVDWSRACLSPDDQFAAVGAADGTMWVWDTKTGSVNSILRPSVRANGPHKTSLGPSSDPKNNPHVSQRAICSVSWNKNGRQIASCDEAGIITLWE